MTSNELVVGEPRLGWLIDGDPSSAEVAVMLRDTGTAIELTIPLNRRSQHNDEYRRWWSFNAKNADDPDRTRFSYRPPKVLLVEDPDGPVVLVGCRPTRLSGRYGVGNGKAIASVAVFGGTHLRYEKVNGLRTEIPALSAWTELTAMEMPDPVASNGNALSIHATFSNVKPLLLSRRLNLTLASDWSSSESHGSLTASDHLGIETLVGRPRDWDEHLRLHRAVLDLVSVAAWQPFGASGVRVQRTDDPERSLGGTVMGPRWMRVASYLMPAHAPWTQRPRFLFPFEEVGRRGVDRWLSLHERYRRAIDPLLNILRSESPWGLTSVVQGGIALEALGYLIETTKNNGARLNSRGQVSFRDGLRSIYDDMATHPIGDRDDWIQRSCESYMAAKHTDRRPLDSLTTLNTLRETILMIRFWIGLELGVDPETLRANLRWDTLASEFQLT